MKQYTNEQLKNIYRERRQKIADYLTENGTGAAVFIDNEEHREPSLRYFTGHPSDAVLIIYSTGKSVLIPWDIILAEKIASADKIIPLTKYKNDNLQAVKANLNAARGVPF